MSYEIPLPMPEQLIKKPIVNAMEVHRYLEKEGFKPIAVVVDNANARIRVFFEGELEEEEKGKLVEAVMEFYRKWISVEK
jgi:hypothetical protein